MVNKTRFNPKSLLSKASYSTESSVVNLIHNHLESDEKYESYMKGLLEFNSKLHSLMCENVIGNARIQTESAADELNKDGMYKGYLTKVTKEYLNNTFNATIEFLDKFTKTVGGRITKKGIENFENAKRDISIPDEPMTDPNPKTGTYRMYHRPNLSSLLSRSQEIAGLVSSLTTDLYNAANDPNFAYNPDTVKFALRQLYKIISCGEIHSNEDDINDAASFKVAMTAIIYVESEQEIKFSDFCEFYSHVTITDEETVSKFLSGVRDEIELAKTKVNGSMIESSTGLKVYQAIDNITSVIECITWVVDNICLADNEIVEYFPKMVKVQDDNAVATTNVMETAMIHGEPFDGYTLFDNEDMRDFIPSEFINLQLESEFAQLNYEYDEFKATMAVNEANILMDNEDSKVERIIAMQEAEQNKFGDKVKQIFNTILNMITKFMGDMKDLMSKDVGYITKWDKYVKNPFAINVSSKGDILAGLTRIDKDVPLTPYNYESMKDNLVNPETFFKNVILPKLDTSGGKRNIRYEDGMKVADFCKLYYGGSSSDESKYPDVPYTAQELESRHGDIVKFLKNPNACVAKIRVTIRNLQNDAKKITGDNTVGQATAPAAGTEGNAGGTAPAATGTPQANQEANIEYYSCLFNRPITEGAILHELEAEPVQQNNAGGATQQQGNQNNTNAGGDANNQQQNGNNAQGNNSTNDAFKVYLNAYKDVLLSKITGAGFMRKEFMDLIRTHCESFMTDEEKQAAKVINKPNAQAANASNNAK